MRPSEREELRERYHFQYAYCGIDETDAGAELTLDHFHPVSKGGTNLPRNRVYSCHACNEFKRAYWAECPELRLPHPGEESLADLIQEMDDGTLLGLSGPGRIMIALLRLNRPQLIVNRLIRRRSDPLVAKEREQLRVSAELLARIRQATPDNPA